MALYYKHKKTLKYVFKHHCPAANCYKECSCGAIVWFEGPFHQTWWRFKCYVCAPKKYYAEDLLICQKCGVICSRLVRFDKVDPEKLHKDHVVCPECQK